MNNHPDYAGHRAAAVVLLCAALLLAGCRAGANRDGRGGRQAATPITIDGQLEDWPANAATIADANWIYFRVSVPDLGAPLQASPETIALWLDADSRAATGTRVVAPAEAAGLGVDLIVQFSPAGDGPGGGRGVVAFATDGLGKTFPLAREQIQILGAPTYAASAYEIRISRHVDATEAPQLAKLLRASGRARAMFALFGPDGRLTGWSDPETFNLPRAGARPPAADAVMPDKTSGAVRVLSWNVLRSELMKNPAPFARVIQVVDPDIILLQEWDTDATTAAAWFTGVVSGEQAWSSVAAKEHGLAVVSPFPVTAVGPERLSADAGEETPRERPVRFLAASVQTPAGPVLVGTTHLKCCGTAGSSEDRRRTSEAVAINSSMKSAFGEAGVPMRLIAGDFNLVGTRTPLDTLRDGLDSDGSELGVAETTVLGDTAIYTWSDPKSEFPDGRLDYAVFSDASADLLSAFILDTRRLSDRALARLGLDRTDTAASDHLPMVIDLRPRP